MSKQLNNSVVSYSVGLTLNIGNYESIKFQIGIEKSCLPNEEQQTYTELTKQVEKLAKAKAKSFRNQFNLSTGAKNILLKG